MPITHTEKMLVTYALPYANGPLHLGHMVGLIQTDIFVRLQRLLQRDCLFISGSDGHGTPIMIQAEKMNIPPEQLIQNVQAAQLADLQGFLINIDNYHSTHSPENQRLVAEIYQRNLAQGNISKRTIKQAYDPVKEMFLPDRYIKGECPRCGAAEQYGDSCEQCGATYSPTELRNAYSTLSGAKPIEKESEHVFFNLTKKQELLAEWTHEGHLQDQVANKMNEWFKAGLQDWDISRDAPYFGFTIPGEANKYFYCWLDAPVGYIASLENYLTKNPVATIEDYWGKDSDADIYHFIGKDIMYFHTLFWPAVLHGADYRLPEAIYCHGFLTINGQKMSKSRGTFIQAKDYLAHLHPEYFRYYLATKLSDQIEDLDINLDDFIQRVNSDLVGKYVNIASRTASFIHKYFAGKLSAQLDDPKLYQIFAATGKIIADKYHNREYSFALRQIMTLADMANQYIDEKKPWSAVKDEAQRASVQDVCTMGINLFRLLTIYLKPILPDTAAKVEAFLQIPPLQWADKDKPLLSCAIAPFQPLLTRIDKKQLDALLAAAEQTNHG